MSDVKFLDKYVAVDIAFGFDQPRRVQRSASLRRFILVSPNKTFNVQFRLPVYDTRASWAPPLGSEMDAFMNAHYDGTPFEQRWFQHLETFENGTITLTEAAVPGATEIKADMSMAAANGY